MPILETLGLTKTKALAASDGLTPSEIVDAIYATLVGTETRVGCTTLKHLKLDDPVPDHIQFYLELNRRSYRATTLSKQSNDDWLSTLAAAHGALKATARDEQTAAETETDTAEPIVTSDNDAQGTPPSNNLATVAPTPDDDTGDKKARNDEELSFGYFILRQDPNRWACNPR